MRALTFIMAICMASTAKAGMFDLPSFNDIKQKIPFMKDEPKKKEPAPEDDGRSFQDQAKDKIQKIASKWKAKNRDELMSDDYT